MKFGGDRIEKRQYFAETDVTVSSLLIKAAHVSDSGNYTCQPAHCPPVSAKVYILKGQWYSLTHIVFSELITLLERDSLFIIPLVWNSCAMFHF